MANLSIVGSHTVNGVSKLHSEILKKNVFHDFYKNSPWKFTNVTNGVFHRRWLQSANPLLCEFLKDLRLERVGAFAFSPEEGTPAAEMEFVDNEIAQKRAEIIEMIQSGIMDDYNAAMIGKTLEVLVEGFDDEFEQYYGRTYADSPDIDGRVWLACDEPLTEGEFVTVCIDSCIEGDLAGYVLEDET